MMQSIGFRQEDSFGEAESGGTAAGAAGRFDQRAQRPGLRETASRELFPKSLMTRASQSSRSYNVNLLYARIRSF
jgi:hypothetical protein